MDKAQIPVRAKDLRATQKKDICKDRHTRNTVVGIAMKMGPHISRDSA